jgi:uncharacterized protein (TIGR00255 family)
MISMTGYGYREYNDEHVQLITELKSYNNRYLDIGVNTPPFLSPLEPAVQSFIKERVERGRIEVTLRVKELEENLSVHLDESAVHSYAEILRRLATAAQIREEPRISHFLRLEGVITQVKNRDLKWFEELVMAQLSSAFEDFAQTRRNEGEATRRDIIMHLDGIEERIGEVERHAGALEERIRRNLRERFEELVGQGLDETRLYQETAVMLMKYGIDEETARMRSHISQFREIASQQKGLGKKLDFVCQELNREINTIGSKSTIAEVNHAVVEIKDDLEKIREQLRNVE